MAEVIRMPRMSDTMTEGVIVSWLKKEGDQVKSGDVMAEVETDKATMELESYSDGTLLYIGVKEGEAVPVDGVLAVIGEKGEDFQSLIQDSPAPKKEEGAKEEEEDVPAEEQKDTQAAAPEGKEPEREEKEKEPQQPQQATDEGGRTKASPLAKKLASEKQVDLGSIKGSGDGGRIVKRDVESAAESGAKAPAAPAKAAVGGYEEVKVSQMRKTIARRLVESKNGAPHFYLTIEVRMERAAQWRKAVNEATGEKVSFNDIVVKSVAATLRRHPKVNASWLGDTIRYHNSINIGVAVAVEDGLLVPVLRDVDQKGLVEINGEVKQLGEKARNKKLQPQEMEGNTFTISNLGMFGIDNFTAIINPPDAAILAVGAIKDVPVVENGELKTGSVMKLTMSCDHRAIDGATGAQFLQTLKKYLEEPLNILA